MSAHRFSAAALAAILAMSFQGWVECRAADARVPHRQASVVLGSSRLAAFRWKATTYRPNAAHGAFRPCLHVAFQPERQSGANDPLEIPIESTNCAPLKPWPDVVSLVDEVHNPKMTAVVMAFPLAAHSVSLYFRGRLIDRTIKLTRLSRYMAKKARVRPFRYGTIAFIGNSCLSRFVAHSRTGRVIYDGGRMKCGVRP